MPESRPSHEQIKAAFLRCNAAEAPAAQAAELAQLERDNPRLAHEVRQLLESVAAGQVIEQVFGFEQFQNLTEGNTIQTASDQTAATVPAGRPIYEEGSTIGAYKLLQKIGEGGMGSVFMAQQTAPIKRVVALKLIKPGLDTQQVIRRFEAERQALAMMDHPNIARVLDAGATAMGGPFFVMELVKGVPITDYCDEANLSTVARLQLFIDVCHAVQHAHQKGIIHRDLKPSNVMITLHDGEPVVKIIDFGIAKATNQDLVEQTMFTHYSQMLGTPLYMSPEQAEFSGLDIDTRSDVYSLGVLLYELLTGSTPFDRESLKSLGLDELRRMIAETEPPRPSQRLSTLRSTHGANTGKQLRRDPRRSETELKGELDWIVMKTLEKDRNRRYESASAFAADIRRYLNDEPVLAFPPSRTYRLKKFIRHRKPLLATVGLIVSALVVGSAIATWQAVVAGYERQRADQTSRWLSESEREKQLHAERSDNVLYASAMRLAYRHLQAGDDEQAQLLLNAWLPHDGSHDRRGLEWHLLQSQLKVPHQELLHLPHDVSCVRISPDNTYLVTGTDGGLIQRRSLIAERSLPAWKTGLTDIRRMEFSPDGSYLAIISYEAEAVVVDTRTGQIQMRCPRPADYNGQPSLCWEAGRLLTTGQGGTVFIWNVEQASLAGTFDSQATIILDICRNPVHNTTFLLTEQAGFTLVSEFSSVAEGETIASLDPSHRTDSGSLAISPDGATLAIGSKLGDIEVWDITEYRRLANWKIGERISELNFSHDSRHLTAAERTGVVHVWNWQAMLAPTKSSGKLPASTLANRTHYHWLAHARPARSAVFTPDSKYIISAGFDGRIVMWNWDQSATAHSVEFEGERCSYISIHAPQNRLVTHVDNHLQTYELDTLKPAQQPITQAAVGSIFASDETGRWLTASADHNAEIYCFDLDRQNALSILPDSIAEPTFSYSFTAFLPGTSSLINAKLAPHARIWGWDADKKTVLFEHSFESIASNKLALAGGSSNALLILTSEALLRVDLPSGKLETCWSVDGRDVAVIAASPDGKILAFGRKNRTIELLDAATGAILHTMLGHLGTPLNLQFTPDGRTLLVQDTRGDLRFWHVASGSELMHWELPAPLQRFLVSPDGQWFATVTQGRLQVTDLRSTNFPTSPANE